jgi:hypothetical protein
MRKDVFERNLLRVKRLSERKHDLDISIIKQLSSPVGSDLDGKVWDIAKRVVSAKTNGAAALLMIGGHVIRSGVQNYLIDMMERNYISCVAMNGAGMIHDFEFALIGATTESVARYITEGQFGLWKETGSINDYINQGYKNDMGMGEAVGEAILKGDFPFKDISILAAGYRLGIPVTIHVGIGYDINHQHPNCSGAAIGETSYRDFLRFAKVMQNLEKGVVMNFGSAVMAPEVFLKALSMARNVAHQHNRRINHFTALVCDLYELGDDFREEPPKDKPTYYFRPWKTMLVRTVANGGESFYIKGRHADVVPALWKQINEVEKCI